MNLAWEMENLAKGTDVGSGRYTKKVVNLLDEIGFSCKGGNETKKELTPCQTLQEGVEVVEENKFGCCI